MHGQRYDLVFGSLKVGVVIQTASDFPNLWGDIEYDPALAKSRSPEVARFVRFVTLNRESTRLVDIEDEQDVSRELAEVNAELEGYTDYIESEDWYLIDADGRRFAIMCPILRGSGEIVWRWDLPSARKGQKPPPNAGGMV
jgi:hypothetical protein